MMKHPPCIRRWLVCGLTCVVWLTAATGLTQQRADSPILVKAITQDQTAVVGELLRDDATELDIFVLETGRAQTLQKDSLKSLRKEISESEAMASSGVAPFLAWKVRKSLPAQFPEGKIAKVDSFVVYVTLGSKAGVSKEHELSVFRGDDEIKDPDSGKVLGVQRRKIARLIVSEVEENFSKAKLLGKLEVDFEVGDVVRPAIRRSNIAVLPPVALTGNDSSRGLALAEEITTGLVKQDIPVVERKLLQSALQELRLQQTQYFDPQVAQRIGKQVGAEAILAGTIVSKGKYSDAHLRLVKVETGQILFTAICRLNRSNSTAPIDANGVSNSIGATGKQQLAIPLKPGIDLRLRLIPAGTFVMGSPAAEFGHRPNESQHEVEISQPFYIGVTEVTAAQWESVMGNEKVQVDSGIPKSIGLGDSIDRFLAKLNESPFGNNYRFRLPTEAEWEYACRAGSTAAFCCGDDSNVLPEFAWFQDRAMHRVAQLKPNAWGLYDMHGNMWEYVSASNPAQQKPSLRGGGWRSAAALCRSANRDYVESSKGDHLVRGFRLACDKVAP